MDHHPDIAVGLDHVGEFNRRESQLRAEQIQFLAVQPTTWAKENAEHALAAKQKSLEMEKAYAQEQARALGGPIEAATKDPALDIRRMLNQIAIASAPADTEVSVTVDRFTEFDVALVLRQPLSLNEVAGITKVFLENTAPYVHSLRFIHGNEVLAQLKQDAIESITNWTAASADSIQTLLLISDTESEPRTAAMAAGDTSATQTDKKDLTPDQIKIDQAQSTFTTHYNEHAHLLQKLAHELSQAAQLDSVSVSRAQLKAQIASLIRSPRASQPNATFSLHQSADLEQLLESQNSDPLVITILKRDVENRTPGASRHALLRASSTPSPRIRNKLKIFCRRWKITGTNGPRCRPRAKYNSPPPARETTIPLASLPVRAERSDGSKQLPFLGK